MGRHFKTYSHSLIDVQLANGHSRNSSTSTATATVSSASYIPVTTSLLSSTTPLRLAPKDEPTRIQLQKQRLREQHVRAPVSAAIPGFKTSAAFFGSLRTNLRLHASPPPSPLSTPNSMQGSTASLPPPSPLSQPALSAMDNVDVPAAEDPLAGVPELTSYLVTDEEERIEALKLVADSVAQQRQLANKALLYSPLNLAILVGIVAQMVRYMIDHHTDYFVIGMSCLGLVMTFMAGTRWATKDYLYAAEEINWEWVGESDFLVTKFGDELIGTLVIEWVSGESRQKRKKAWRGFVKAWTVKQKYRHKGVGSALLEDAIKEAKKKGAEGLEFDDLHANSKRVLPSIYNSGFDKRDRMARELLEDLKQSSPSGGKRK